MTPKPLAITPAYNEADIIAHTVRHLRSQGFDSLVIDNWSTDRTYEAAADAGALVVKWPKDGPSDITRWADMLKFVAELARSHDGWVMFNDADELRSAPGGLTLDAWFECLSASGMNAAAFTVRTYWPIDNGYDGSISPSSYFKHYTLDGVDSMLPHVKAWHQPSTHGRIADLHSSGGHHVQFPGVRYSLQSPGLIRHYPIRSQSHGERKVFHERNARWSPAEKRAQWHVQYNHFSPGDSFLRSPSDHGMLRDEEP